jgi:hypothetical protein
MTKNLIASPRAKIALVGGLVLVLALIGWVTSALAITWGEPDEANAYPNVGAFIVERDDGRIWATCTGTLIHEQVFLTAGHCTDYVAGLDAEGRLVAAYVSFDFDVGFDAESETGPTLLEVEEIITHPEYDDFSDPSNTYDVGALVLAEPVTGIEPAERATEGFLDELKRSGVLRTGPKGEAGAEKGFAGPDGAKFTVVGYGGVLLWPPPEITYEDQRRFGESEYVALVPAQLHMDQNRLHDNEGTCFGDSGGPAFWEPDEETRILVGITSWGDAQCVVTGIDYRVDIPETLSFIDGVIADLQQ